MVRVIIPYHLKTLAGVSGEVALDVDVPVTLRSVLDALEARYPMLRGTIRDQVTGHRRPMVRFFACEQDFSNDPPDTLLPDAVAAGHQGAILSAIAESGLRVVALKSLRLDDTKAKGFYHVHAARPFFGDLVRFMTEGPIVAMVLEGDDAVSRWRELMGPTDAAKAPPTTLRGKFGKDIERNAVHGSDGPDTAAFEIGFFFSGLELAGL